MPVPVLRRIATALLLAGCGNVASVATAATVATKAGVYGARLCTAVGAAALQCSAVRVELANGRLRIELNDFVYRLQLGANELEATLSQGRMQVDGFSAGYAWNGSVLRFADVAHDVRYEVRFGRRLRPRHQSPRSAAGSIRS